MSNELSPGTLITEEDPAVLDSRLKALQREQLTMKFDESKYSTDEEKSQARTAFDLALANIIREQLGIIMKLRRTQTGPAAKGGKRAKKAPVDLDKLMSELGV